MDSAYKRLFQNVHIAEEDKLPPLSRRLGFRPTTECRFSCVMHSVSNHSL